MLKQGIKVDQKNTTLAKMIELSERLLKEKANTAEQIQALEEKNRINNEEAAMFEEQL